MLNITYKDISKTNITGQGKDKSHRYNQQCETNELFMGGHINSLRDDRWASHVTTWRPYDKTIRQGRPAKRWRDDMDKILERHDLAEDSTSLPPTIDATRRNGDPIIFLSLINLPSSLIAVMINYNTFCHHDCTSTTLKKLNFWRAVESRTERTWQTTDQMHPLNGHD